MKRWVKEALVGGLIVCVFITGIALIKVWIDLGIEKVFG